MKRIAFFVSPHVGGTHSVFRAFRHAMQERAIDVRWLALGQAPNDSTVADERSTGIAIGYRGGESLGPIIERVIEEIQSGNFDAVVVNVLADPVLTNAVRYLPGDVRRLLFVHSISRGTYAAARAVSPHVDLTIAVSPRIRDDLVRHHGFKAEQTIHIPNAVLGSFPARSPRTVRQLKLVYMGRLEDSSKGVFDLPKIMAALPGDIGTLHIYGDGPDREELIRRCASLGDRIRFMGAVSPQNVPEILSRYDISLAPSRYEGFGISIVEAMSAGLAVVASRIVGVTDSTIEDGVTGFLFPVGSVIRAAAIVSNLAANPEVLERVGSASQIRASQRYSIQAVGPAYVEAVDRLFLSSPVHVEPLDVRTASVPIGLKPGVSRFVPSAAKRFLRWARERFRK